MRQAFCLSIVLTLAAASARASDYIFVDAAPAGASYSQANGIRGHEVAGTADSAAFYGTDLLPSTSLQPVGVDSSLISAVGLNLQVGSVTIGLNGHAAIWRGTTASYERLNDVGYTTDSSANAVSTMIAGTGISDATSRSTAIVWINAPDPNNAPTAMPTPGTFGAYAYISAGATAIHNTRVAGFAGLDDAANSNHAATWNISDLANITFTDLNPASYENSTATGTWGNQLVGYGAISGVTHALLWTLSGDSVDSVVDLTPAGYDYAYAFATNGTWQVGFATNSAGDTHAFRWEGTAESAVDLGIYLPAGWTNPMALAIDQNGFIAGMATDSLGVTHAVAWVPEPASLAILALGGSLLLRRRRS